MTISKLRSWLYKAARVVGDVQAVRRGRVGKRVQNRLIGRGVSKILRKLWR